MERRRSKTRGYMKTDRMCVFGFNMKTKRGRKKKRKVGVGFNLLFFSFDIIK